MGRLTDYGSFFWCDNCDHGYLPNEYDGDARMCKACASVMEEEDG
jgi:uncharacterized protein (DUF983 family)